MPKFYFSQDRHENDEAIEAIMTFVLGLVAEPPAAQYIYKPNAASKRRSIRRPQAARQVQLRRLPRAGNGPLGDRISSGLGRARRRTCRPQGPVHGPVPEFNDCEFLRPHFTPAEVATSLVADRRDRLHATIVGAPARSTDGSLKRFDDEGCPLTPDDPTAGKLRIHPL